MKERGALTAVAASVGFYCESPPEGHDGITCQCQSKQPTPPKQAMNRPQSPVMDESGWSDNDSDNEAFFAPKDDPLSFTSSGTTSFGKFSSFKVSQDSETRSTKGKSLPVCSKYIRDMGLQKFVALLESEDQVASEWHGLARLVTSLILRFRVLDFDYHGTTKEITSPQSRDAADAEVGNLLGSPAATSRRRSVGFADYNI